MRTRTVPTRTVTGRTRVAALAVGVLLLAACGQGPDGADQPRATPGQSDSPTATAPPSAEPTTDPSSAEPPEVTEAIADLAAHLELSPDDVTVVSYEDVTWPDGSLGCPQPGMSYTQALVPGARLVLEAQDREFSYHSGREPGLVRCDNPQQPVTDAVS